MMAFLSIFVYSECMNVLIDFKNFKKRCGKQNNILQWKIASLIVLSHFEMMFCFPHVFFDWGVVRRYRGVDVILRLNQCLQTIRAR